ncbi:MAG: FtsH protease activity modulator HflK [Myxococcota bacterium]
MAENDGSPSVDSRVNRSVGRTLRNSVLVMVVLGLLAGWGYLGLYELEPGQSAIVFRLGKYQRTEPLAGLRFHLPAPFEEIEIVNVAELSRQDFGVKGEGDLADRERAEMEASMQTGDNSIVSLGFVVQYRISDAFDSRYGVADPEPTLRDAAQAAVREVVGQMTVDGVLTERRGEIESESKRILQDILDSYSMGIDVMEIQLQEVQPPEQVREAFDDVIAAAQDASLTVNKAEGYKNELLPTARAEATELVEAAQGYRDAKIAEAKGEAQRFAALVVEYHRAPEVTQKRLYLETMEEVLPAVSKVIIEPGTAQVLPYLPLSQGPAAQDRGGASKRDGSRP